MCRATVLCSALLHSSLVQAANSILKIVPWTKLFASWLSFSMYNYWIMLINWTRGQLVIFQSTNIFRAAMGRRVKSFSSTFKSRLANHTREQEWTQATWHCPRKKKLASGSKNMKAIYNNTTSVREYALLNIIVLSEQHKHEDHLVPRYQTESHNHKGQKGH